jgi:hypothetical protein
MFPNWEVSMSQEQKIIIGSSIQLDMTLIDTETKQPYDLTGYTEITVILPAIAGVPGGFPAGQINFTANNGAASGTVSVLNSAPGAGRIRLQADPIWTTGFLEDEDGGSIEVLVDKGTLRKIAQVIERVPIVARLYS